MTVPNEYIIIHHEDKIIEIYSCSKFGIIHGAKMQMVPRNNGAKGSFLGKLYDVKLCGDQPVDEKGNPLSIMEELKKYYVTKVGIGSNLLVEINFIRIEVKDELAEIYVFLKHKGPCPSSPFPGTMGGNGEQDTNLYLEFTSILLDYLARNIKTLLPLTVRPGQYDYINLETVAELCEKLISYLRRSNALAEVTTSDELVEKILYIIDICKLSPVEFIDKYPEKFTSHGRRCDFTRNVIKRWSIANSVKSFYELGALARIAHSINERGTIEYLKDEKTNMQRLLEVYFDHIIEKRENKKIIGILDQGNKMLEEFCKTCKINDDSDPIRISYFGYIIKTKSKGRYTGIISPKERKIILAFWKKYKKYNQSFGELSASDEKVEEFLKTHKIDDDSDPINIKSDPISIKYFKYIIKRKYIGEEPAQDEEIRYAGEASAQEEEIIEAFYKICKEVNLEMYFDHIIGKKTLIIISNEESEIIKAFCEKYDIDDNGSGLTRMKHTILEMIFNSAERVIGHDIARVTIDCKETRNMLGLIKEYVLTNKFFDIFGILDRLDIHDFYFQLSDKVKELSDKMGLLRYMLRYKDFGTSYYTLNALENNKELTRCSISMLGRQEIILRTQRPRLERDGELDCSSISIFSSCNKIISKITLFITKEGNIIYLNPRSGGLGDNIELEFTGSALCASLDIHDFRTFNMRFKFKFSLNLNYNADNIWEIVELQCGVRQINSNKLDIPQPLTDKSEAVFRVNRSLDFVYCILDVNRSTPNPKREASVEQVTQAWFNPILRFVRYFYNHITTT